MANKKIKHIIAKLFGTTTLETLDVYDESALHADNIVNAGTTTASGYVLDARQANPNISGTLAAQISSLNDSLLDSFLLYPKLGTNINISSTKTNYSSYNNRSVRECFVIIICWLVNDMLRASACVPITKILSDVAFYQTNLFYVDSVNTQRYAEITYVNDTTISVIGSSNASGKIIISGLAKGNSY